MWVIKAWNWLKENSWAAWTALGATISAAIAIFLATAGDDEVLEKALENKKESDEDKAKTDKEKLERIEEFHRATEEIIKEAERKKQELTEKEKEALEEKKKLYADADTPEKRKKVIDDVKDSFPELNFVPLDSIAKVEDND